MMDEVDMAVSRLNSLVAMASFTFLVGCGDPTYREQLKRIDSSEVDQEIKIIKPIDSYGGDKLLFCSGHPILSELQDVYPNENYSEDKSDWYTVDTDPLMRPDMLADIRNPEIIESLQKRKFSVVIDEFCPWHESYGSRFVIAPLLKPNGIWVGKVLVNFYELQDIRADLLKLGFKKIVFGHPPKREGFSNDPQYWMKYVSNEELIKAFEDHPYTKYYRHPLATKLDRNQWYNFIAIKG